MHYPGAGVGGHCIPKDSWLLIHEVRDIVNPQLIPTARYINDFMPVHMYDLFTTTLSSGPMKDADVINRIGREVGGDRFISDDYKKSGGLERASTLAKELGLYRQEYCGCVYGHEQQLLKKNGKSRNGKSA